MSERVTMPALGESVTEGTVTRWLKNVGDTVEVDEPLVEVSTDKVDTEIPSPVAGVLQEILAEEDATVEVGGELCVVGDGSGDPGAGDADDAAQTDEDQTDEDQTADEEVAEDPAGDPGDGVDEPEQGSDEAPAQQRGPTDEEAQDTSGGGADTSGGGGSGGSGGGSGGETVTMPALGESVTEGTVTRWLKSEGDTVEVDEPLVEVSTDKVDTEIPSPVAGVLTKILAGEDETVEVGGDLCVVGGEAAGTGDAGSAEESDAGAGEESDAGSAEDDDAGSAEESPAGAAAGGGGSSDKSAVATTGADSAGAADSDLGQEQQIQQAAAEESQTKSDEDETTEDASEMKEPEPAVGVGTVSPDNGTTSHKDTGDVGAPAQDVSAYVTPLVRKLAAQHGVDLNSLTGTGVGGRIRKQDVLEAAKAAEAATAAPQAGAEAAPSAESAAPAADAAAAPSAAPAAASSAPAGTAPADAKRGTTEKMSRLRKVIATRMVESLQTAAQLTTVVEVDITKVARLRNRTKNDFAQREGTKLSFMPFFAMAAVEALKAHPIVNASVEGDTINYHAAEHLGVAVDTPRGLLVPVIKDAGDLNIAGLARKIADLAERTRDNKVTPDELSGGTFTLTNTGSRGALFDTPIINMPNVAILGTGAVVKRPVVVTDEDGSSTIAIRDMVYLALSYDHRVVDGADAARFLMTMKERLEEGNFEV